ncbi:Mce protein [Mycobacterium sp. Aquia_213]|uniref:Mce protein n=1 Tax=Mycobacterium sp. Aquia_213 TaxID=2991728 RepID=UPI00226F6FF7|nr:Mce protein [Mycobacterium sp. Aquia_213]WAC91328.1 Mce protein [Mycobacterium sp. Aquia_213]
MEGDAGASRLNPPPMSMLSRLRRRRPKDSDDVTDETNPEVTAEDSSESEDGADQTNSEVEADQAGAEVTAPDSPDPEPEATPEAAAPEQPEAEAESEPAADDAEQPEADGDHDDADAAAEADGSGRPPSALGRAWLAGIAAALVLLAGAVGTGGYLALRYHHESQAIARNNAAALKAAIECVSATQAPDTNAMIASEQKIIECGTGAFREQAMVYTGMLVQAYQSANIHVQVADVRAAVERNNKDGSIEVLVAMRVKVATEQSENETGYRLRVKMALDEGQYRIARLDQVTK